MKTDNECIDCLLEQVRTTVRLCTKDPDLENQIVAEASILLGNIDMTASPPENAIALYRLIAELSSVSDPFATLKEESNVFALTLREKVRNRINNSEDPLYTAVRYAIAANIIDYGARHEFDAFETLSRCMETDLSINDYLQFQKDIQVTEGKNILYLADNCGEIVFDALLIEQLVEHGYEVTCAVRGEKIINDATLQDAHVVGLHEVCHVISNGTPCPGTPLASAGDELRKTFYRADIIISKGQGNFETLSDVAAPIFFFLTVKCPVVARYITAQQELPVDSIKGEGEMVLMKKEKTYVDTTD